MAFKSPTVRSRLSPPRTRTHVAVKVHGFLFYKQERIFDSGRTCREQAGGLSGLGERNCRGNSRILRSGGMALNITREFTSPRSSRSRQRLNTADLLNLPRVVKGQKRKNFKKMVL